MELVRGETFADIFLDRVSERSPNRPLHPTGTALRRPRVSARSLGLRKRVVAGFSSDPLSPSETKQC